MPKKEQKCEEELNKKGKTSGSAAKQQGETISRQKSQRKISKAVSSDKLISLQESSKRSLSKADSSGKLSLSKHGSKRSLSKTDSSDKLSLSKHDSKRSLSKADSSDKLRSSRHEPKRSLSKSKSSDNLSKQQSRRNLSNQESKRNISKSKSSEDLSKQPSRRNLSKEQSRRTISNSKSSEDLSKQQSRRNLSKQEDNGSTASKKTGKGHRKKKKVPTTTLTALQDALEGLTQHVARSKDADKALRRVDKAMVQMEKQWQEISQHPPPATPQQGDDDNPQEERVLNAKYTLHVNDPTPTLQPFENVTLHRATYAANNPSEDRSTVVVGDDDDDWIFAGVWDGHGGTFASEFTQDHLFDFFQEAYEDTSKSPTVAQAFQFAFNQTDRAYYEHCRQVNIPSVYFAGTCAIACFVDIKTGLVTCSNLGDSRAVMGLYKKDDDQEIKTIPLSVDHSADNLLEQTRIRQLHPDDQDILVNGGDSDDPDWRVKKLAAFTRSIGDLHLKEKNTAALFNSYVAPEMRILPRPGLRDKQTGVITPTYISTEPDFQEATVKNGFIIIACDGVWDEMSSEQAVHIVACLLSQYDPTKNNIAELFIEETLKRAVRRIARTYEEESQLTLDELKKRPPGKASAAHRSFLHDDITVVILQFGKVTATEHSATILQSTDEVASEKDRSRMGRTKEKREMAVRDSISKYTEEIDKLQADASRRATDRQIIEMMLAFEDLNARHLKILFNAVDVDGNGTLDREEVTRLIKNVIDMDVSAAVVDLAFSEMDTDGSGDIDFEEFVQFFGK